MKNAQKRIILAVIYGLTIAFYSNLLFAKDKVYKVKMATPVQETLVIETSSRPNTTELNNFIETQNAKKINYIATINNKIIFSKKPIPLPHPKLFIPYFAKNLAALGLTYNANYAMFGLPGVTSIPNFQLTNKSASQIPAIPRLIIDNPTMFATRIESNLSLSWVILGTAIFSLSGIIILSRSRKALATRRRYNSDIEKILAKPINPKKSRSIEKELVD